MKLLDVIDEFEVISEANVAAKIKDPKTIKMVAIAMKHDSTLPKHKVAALGPAAFGPEPKDETERNKRNAQILKLWSDLLDESLRTTDYGDISADGKFDEWLTRLYMNGILDYEDISGEGGDALGAWKALSIRNKLKPEHQDFNKFKNLRQIQSIVQNRDYRDELRKIKDAEVIEKHKREKKETTLIDDDRYLVVVPYNYGSCYTFNNSEGFQASFCTGSSSGMQWFTRYAPDGPIISIVDKQNQDDVNGKWQIHAPTNQMNNGNQTISYRNGDTKFAELFPGLLKKIGAAMKSKSEEIVELSKEITRGKGYDVESEINELKNKFPLAWNSEPEQADQGPGTFNVTHIPSNRTISIEGDSVEDVIRKVIERHPTITPEDLRVERAAD